MVTKILKFSSHFNFISEVVIIILLHCLCVSGSGGDRGCIEVKAFRGQAEGTHVKVLHHHPS